MVIILFLLCIQSFGQLTLSAAGPGSDLASSVTASSSGWTISANREQGVINIEHESLGIVLKDIRLNVQSVKGLITLNTCYLRLRDAVV